MTYTTGETVTEQIGSGRTLTRRTVKLIAHDGLTCRTEHGHVYLRATGTEYLRGDVYRAIHDPAYDLGGEKHLATLAEMRESRPMARALARRRA